MGQPDSASLVDQLLKVQQAEDTRGSMLEVLRKVYGPPESTTDVESKVRTEEKRVSSVDQLLKTQQAEADLRASMLEVLNGVYGPPESTIHSAELQTVKTQVRGRHQAANHKKGLNYFDNLLLSNIHILLRVLLLALLKRDQH